MKTKHIWGFLLIFVVGCSSPASVDTMIPTIDVEKALNHTEKIVLSDIATGEIEYIPLETNSKSPISVIVDVVADEKFIIVFARNNIQLYERKTGKFIREIARPGWGRNNYTHYSAVSFDENRKTLMLGSTLGTGRSNGAIEYNLEGRVTRKITFSDFPKDKDGRMLPLDENNFALYVENLFGDEPYRLYLLDDKGKSLNKFPHGYSFEPLPGGGYASYPSISYKWNNDVYFYENFVDTLYKISREELIPHFHFHLGKYNPPSHKKSSLHQPDAKPLKYQYVFFQLIRESDHLLFFSFSHNKDDRLKPDKPGVWWSQYFGFYDKRSGVTKISEVDNTNKSPLLNDIDDFAPIHPNWWRWSINQSGEFVTHMEVDEILDWFDANPEKAKGLPEHIRALSKLKYDDNQVVIIFKLKH